MSGLLVTGGSGQLATALAAAHSPLSRHVVGRPAFDFDRPESVLDTLRAARPSIVINAAAYTAVDRAETEPDPAMRANRDGPGLLAEFCAQNEIPLIHVSTDYVFDGDKGSPYVETDPTNPTGVYGASKLAGEQAVLATCPRAIVLRTAWVYAPRGKNFVLTMLAAARKMSKLRVVADQRGNPTSADALARAILDLVARIEEGWRDEFSGVYHAAGSGDTTWHGLAVATFEQAARHGMRRAEVEAITTADWPTPARRPADSRLDCTKLADVFGVRLPPWPESLGRAIDAVASG